MRRIVVAIGVSALLAGCGGSGSPSASSSSVTTAARRIDASPSSATSSTPCITRTGYGGLGANANAFDANNNNSTGPAEPTPGAAWYQVTRIQGGCVAAYTVQETGAPPLRARDMLLLISRAYLPDDAKRVVNRDNCAIWKSQTLKHTLGVLYAEATASPQSVSVPGTAQIEATADSTCRLP